MSDVPIPGKTYLEKIKDGGTSSVWKIKDNVTGEVRAAKVMLARHAGSKEIYANLQTEAQAMREFDHDGIVHVYEFYPLKPRPVTEMEYFPSIDVKSALRQAAPLVKQFAVAVINQTLSAMQHVHSHNFIHKDMKPENILLAKNGRAKVIDFSLSEVVKKKSIFGFGKPKKIQGTPMYMAPEQIRKDWLDERTDIYSMGLTFYEMLTWRMPFIGQNEQSILQKNLSEMPVAPHKVNESVPRLLSDIIMKMIEKKPDDRYQSVEAVNYDFKKFLMDAKKRTQKL